VAGPKTIAALNGQTPDAVPLKLGEPVWVLEGRRKLGLHESLSSAALKAWLKSDGHTIGDPAVHPWCGDFVETCIRLALPDEAVPTNPYLARNWLSFGVVCPELVVGAVAVFWRGSKTGSQGHVGFVVGQNTTYLSVLGGNQGNTVSVSRIAKNRLLGCRWPRTAGAISVTAMGPAIGDLTDDEA
jgi:uncharacterized protein (TIGR02594 family)